MRKNIFLWLLVSVVVLPLGAAAVVKKTSPCIKITRTLKYGAKDTKTNKDVSKLQQFLKARGYYSGTVGGGFGAKTKTALQKFQVASGLYEAGVSKKSSYGVVDSKTRFKIQQLTCTKTKITVDEPNTSLVWNLGDTKTIKWTANNVDKVDIILRDRSRSGGIPVDLTIISKVDASEGSYSWTIPSNVVPSNRYSILIRGGGVSDESNFYFAIQALIRGGGGGGGGGGSCRDLYWFDDRNPDCTANGQRTFCSDLPTEYNFTSADTLAGCRAKMPDLISVYLSTGAASVQRGVPVTIRWTDRASTTKYDIKLTGGGGYLQNIKTNINPFSYSWAVGTVDIDATTNRQIPKVVDTGRYNVQVCRYGTTVCGVSPDLPIGSARYILAPGSGSAFLLGDSVSLDWTNNSGAELAGAKATLYKGSNASSYSLTPSGDGKATSWIVPSSLTSGSDYFFRVVSRNSPYSFSESRSFSVGSTETGSTIFVDPNPATVNRGSMQTITWRDSVSTSSYSVFLRRYGSGSIQYTLVYSNNLPANNSGVHSFSWTAGNDAGGNPIPDGQYYYTVCHNSVDHCGYSADDSGEEFTLTTNEGYIQLPELSATCGGDSCNDAGNGHPIWHARPAEPSSRYYLACSAGDAGEDYYSSGTVIADLAEALSIERINIDFKQTGAAPGRAPCRYELAVSSDGNNWVNADLGGVTGACSASNQLDDITLNHTYVARYVRLTYYMDLPGTCLALNKFNVLESGSTAGFVSRSWASVSGVINNLLRFLKK